MAVVTVIKEFRLKGKDYKPGDKLHVTMAKAEKLAYQGLIKSIIRPVIDKMIREPQRRK